jgi:protease-4
MQRFTGTLGALALVALFGVRPAPADAPREDPKADAAKAADRPKTDDKKADKARLAVFRLKGGLSEIPEEDPLPFGGSPTVSLKEMVERMRKAKDDASVKAVVLLEEGGAAGQAQVEEVRQAMAELRAAGKEIYAHADSIGMRAYVLLSGVTRLSAVPTADLWVTGMYGEAMFLRGLLEKIGVKPDFLTCGAYKSAAELFMRDSPSPEADAMQNWLMDGIYNTHVALIAKGRKVDAEKVKAWINAGPYSAERGQKAGLIDAVESRQEFEAVLKEKFGKDVVFDHKYGKKKQPEMDLSSPFAVLKVWGDLLNEAKKKKSDKPAVGIVYVNGPIMVGGRQSSPLDVSGAGAFSTPIRKALDDAARDDSVKAVVLRVDSPGGSAVASEIILDATRRVKAKKPFVVSMGDVAGSGGYYVACGSDVIFADESTITGSIGVLSGKLATRGMWNKVGVTFKGYQRGENAGMLASGDPFTEAERERMRAYMNEIYEVFKGHVVQIRGTKLKKPIDELAGGRVYTGRQALDLGLVDRMGTLEDAVKYVAEQAKLSDYAVRVVPEPKNFIEQLVEEMTGGKDEPGRLGVGNVGNGLSLVDLALPYLRGLEPHRVAAVTAALSQLQMLHGQGVLLWMPEQFAWR